ncbi:MAG TPA: phosphoribosylanthranilate isomerase, partial [Fibrobacteria bacterium]|nr:phosphoribosylanthranilate isomerase [Fibrobacteria bacterium]
LGPHNLAEAVAACRPFAVDLNSKVEISPGRKDLSRVEACLKLLGR